MADAKLKFNWESPDLRRLLVLRDRFTQTAVKKAFEKDPNQGRILLDADQKLFATPVTENKYTVIWRQADADRIDVKAVVASQFRDESPAEFKAKLEKVVDLESHGMVKLG